MRKILYLLTDPNGRISRKQFLLGMMYIMVAFLAITAVLLALGIRVTDTIAGSFSENGGPVQQYWRTSWTLPTWHGFVLTVMATIPIIILSIKRRKDRDNPGFDAVVYWVLYLVANLLPFLGASGFYLNVLQIIVSFLSIYIFILLGFLKGTTGPNKYGPDPLSTNGV